MRLTKRHVALLARDIADPGPMPDVALSTDEDYARYVADILAAGPGTGEVWLFAYGSLIWKPACAFVEIRTGTLRGWHRAFCLGWTRRFRATDDNPGLMLALDRGGTCKGALYRLPPGQAEPNLNKLVQREMPFKPSSFPPRWVNVATETGVTRAITFCIDRKGGRYVTGLSDHEVADVLARAVGSRGSMAEYLYSTVRHLEDLDIHDRHLWRLQELVADRIEAAYGADH